jgi:hypothetical protein
MENLSLPFPTTYNEECFVLHELNCVLTECKNNRTPGKDNVSTELFKYSGTVFKESLLTFLNNVLQVKTLLKVAESHSNTIFLRMEI